MLLGTRRAFIGNPNNMGRKALQNWLDFFAGKLTIFVDNTMEDIAIALFSGTLNYTSISVSVTLNALKTVSGRNIFYGSIISDLTCPNLVSVSGSQQFQGSTSLKSVYFPNLQTVSDFNWWFFNCTSLQNVNLGAVQSLSGTSGTSFANCSALTDVFVENMQSATLLSYTGMLTTATTGFYTPHQVAFHCADGDVVWSDDDSAWTLKTA